MKIFRKSGLAEYITLTYCIAFAILPFTVFSTENIEHALNCVFRTFPTNYLLYISPVALFFFLKKSEIEEKDKLRFLVFFDTAVITLFYSALQMNSGSMLFTFVAIIMLSLICININEFTGALALLPGILLPKLGTEFIFAAFLPILAILVIRYCGNRKQTEKSSSLLPFAYLYTIVLAAILFISGKITFSQNSVIILTANFNQILRLICGMAILVAASTLFILRNSTIIKNGTIAEKSAIIFIAVYPLAVSIANCFVNLISTDTFAVILCALVMYTAANIQINITYKNKAAQLIPAKAENMAFSIAAVLIFCVFSFD